MGALANNCLRLLPTLTSNVDGLTKSLTETEDHTSAVSLRSSLFESSTALAEILGLMWRISPEPLETDYRRRCIAALMRAVEVIHRLGQDDFLVVGLFIAVRFHELE